jgi:CRISPR/Cas system-associated protein endoribonuclease Cas2
LPKFDWCLAIGGARVNPIISNLIEFYKTMMPEFVRPCPFEGSVRALDLTLNSNALMLVPSGVIRFTELLYNEEDEMILALALVFNND